MEGDGTASRGVFKLRMKKRIIKTCETERKPAEPLRKLFFKPRSPIHDPQPAVFRRRKRGLDAMETIRRKLLTAAAMRMLSGAARQLRGTKGICRLIERHHLREWLRNMREMLRANVQLQVMSCQASPVDARSCVSAALALVRALPEYWALLQQHLHPTETTILQALPKQPNSCFEAVSQLLTLIETTTTVPACLRSQVHLFHTCQQCGKVSQSKLYSRYLELAPVPVFTEVNGFTIYADLDFASTELNSIATQGDFQTYLAGVRQGFEALKDAHFQSNAAWGMKDCLQYEARVRRDVEGLVCRQCGTKQLHLQHRVRTVADYLLCYLPPHLPSPTITEHFTYGSQRFSLVLVLQSSPKSGVLVGPQWRSGVTNPQGLLYKVGR